jgi:predicted enzyme related to lactoylglutathione lyase
MSKKKAAKKSAAKTGKKTKVSKAKPKPAARKAKKAVRSGTKKSAVRRAAKTSAPAAETTTGAWSVGEVTWNELMTVAGDSPIAFYTQLLGWTSRPFGQGMDYTVLEHHGKPVAGVVVPPEGGPPPMWLPYITVGDIDAAVVKAEMLGGRVCKTPFPVPDVGRIAIVQDPHGAMFGLHSA